MFCAFTGPIYQVGVYRTKTIGSLVVLWYPFFTHLPPILFHSHEAKPEM